MQQKNIFDQPVGPLVCHTEELSWPPTQVLSGTSCKLETLDIGLHADDLYDALQADNRGESWTYLPYGPFEDKKVFREWLHDLVATEKDTQLYVILTKDTGTPIGILGYLRITPRHATIEIGHVHFPKRLQKTPAATEAIYLMLKRAFASGYRRCEWKCDALNGPSQQAARRFGFTFEGIFRQHMIIKQRNRDTAWFSMLDSEWPRIQQRFERWLSPNNFDAAGKQHLSLLEC